LLYGYVSVSAALVHELILGPDCNPTIGSGEAATAAPAGQEETKQGTAAKTSQTAGWALETFSSCACSLLHLLNMAGMSVRGVEIDVELQSHDVYDIAKGPWDP
jgi:hypothetical protein